jgi:hypothetical protein
MKRYVPFAAAAAALAAAGVAYGAPTPRQFCQVQFDVGGPLYSGTGVSVSTLSGRSLSICRVRVTPPPETVVTTFPDSRGDIIVITRSGAAIIVFRTP